MISIYLKDGSIDTWHEYEYTDYVLDGNNFIIYNGIDGVGFYNFDCVVRIVVGEVTEVEHGEKPDIYSE